MSPGPRVVDLDVWTVRHTTRLSRIVTLNQNLISVTNSHPDSH